MEGDTMRMRSKLENELNGNKVQFARNRDENAKFRSHPILIPILFNYNP